MFSAHDLVLHFVPSSSSCFLSLSSSSSHPFLSHPSSSCFSFCSSSFPSFPLAPPSFSPSLTLFSSFPSLFPSLPSLSLLCYSLFLSTFCFPSLLFTSSFLPNPPPSVLSHSVPYSLTIFQQTSPPTFSFPLPSSSSPPFIFSFSLFLSLVLDR